MKQTLTCCCLALVIAGCTASASSRPIVGGAPEGLRVDIARLLLRTPSFGSISLIKAKIINARISQGEQRRSVFSGEPFIHYCVQAAIENPLFPIHQPAYAEVEITATDRGRNIRVRPSRSACFGSNFQPFPEIEELSVRRYESS